MITSIPAIWAFCALTLIIIYIIVIFCIFFMIFYAFGGPLSRVLKAVLTILKY